MMGPLYDQLASVTREHQWDNVADGREPILHAFSATSILLIVPGPTVFLKGPHWAFP